MTRWLYLGVLLLVVGERLFELRRARANERVLRARGALELGRGLYPFMVAMHTAFLLACALEVLWLSRPFVPWLAAISGLCLAGSMSLRYWAVRSLGDRWNTRVLIEPGMPPVVTGPYRLLRHPNYLAVVVEVAALPLLHTAWLTATVFTVLDSWVLRRRLATEDRALDRLIAA